MLQENKTKMVQKTATEDITCYKVVTRFKGGRMGSYDEYDTPLLNIEVGKTYVDNNRFYQQSPTGTDFYNSTYKMYQGGFLSFANLGDAMVKTGPVGLSENVCVRCIIPKGSKYYEGFYATSSIPTYFSKELHVQELVSLK